MFYYLWDLVMKSLPLLKRLAANWTDPVVERWLDSPLHGWVSPFKAVGDNLFSNHLHNYSHTDKGHVCASWRISSKSELDWNTKDFSPSIKGKFRKWQFISHFPNDLLRVIMRAEYKSNGQKCSHNSHTKTFDICLALVRLFQIETCSCYNQKPI